jgi:glycosyltransferase involved in cell wall biosynthesis
MHVSQFTSNLQRTSVERAEYVRPLPKQTHRQRHVASQQPARIALDLTRLLIGPMNATPRGIDRVDLGYARHFLASWNGDCIGTLPGPWGVRWFDREQCMRVVHFIEGFWREAIDPDHDPAYRSIKNWLLGWPSSLDIRTVEQKPAYARVVCGLTKFVREAGFSVGRPIDTIPPGTIYLNTGQIAIAVPRLLRWLDRRPDVKPVFMLHDAIPVENTEYVSPTSSMHFRNMLANTARYAAGLIVTTRAAQESIGRAMVQWDRGTRIPVVSAPLPVSGAFLQPPDPDPDLAGSKYFIVTGAIDPRKNHLLLLNVWRDLVRQHGENAPKLVLAGPRWRTSDTVTDMLERCASIRSHVHEVAGLSTPGLRRLLAGARALLMPSFAEGFGLPIVEALALGTPVIASDLTAHHEAGADYVTYLSPIDGIGWASAIRSHAKEGSGGSAVRARLRTYRAWTWPEYFRRIDPFLMSLAGSTDKGIPQSHPEVDPCC